MKPSKIIIAILGVLLVSVLAVTSVYAQDTQSITAIRQINQQLTEAGFPLTERQINYLKGLDADANLREVLRRILTEEQMAVLTGQAPVPSDNIPTIRRINQRLTEAGVPLTERQINYLKGLDADANLREVLRRILTVEQMAVLTGQAPVPSDNIPTIRRINQRLTEAGFPLTERQINYLKGLDADTNLREVLRRILTEEQVAALGSRIEETVNPDQNTEKAANVDLQPGQYDILHQNYPNPFNPETTIEYEIASPGTVTIDVFDNNGKFIERLVDETQNAGKHSVNWDASPYAAGLYLYQITANGFTYSKKMSYVK